MRRILALVAVVGLSLGMAKTSRAQVVVGVNPWGGTGVAVGNPYGAYYSGYGLPGATVYSSGYYGMAPATTYSSFYAPPAAYPYGYGYAPGGWSVQRRGLFGRRVVSTWW
jgi:hypothetical protein